MQLSREKFITLRSIVILSVLLLCSCTSLSQKYVDLAQQNIANKNFDLAFDQTYNALKKDIRNKEAIAIFPKAYQKAVQFHNSKINTAKQNDSWNIVADEYDQLCKIDHKTNEIKKLVKQNYKNELSSHKKKSSFFSKITASFSVPQKDLKKIVNLKVANLEKERKVAHQKASAQYYQKGKQLAQEKKYRAASEEFDKALSYIPNYKDAQSLKVKYNKMANEKDAETHYQKGKQLAQEKKYRAASEEFDKALSYIPNYKDAQSLKVKYNKMANEKDAETHYQKGKRLMKEQKYSLAYDEFVKTNRYIYAYKNVLDLMKKAKSKMPPDKQEIKGAIERCLSKYGVPVSWVGNLMGGGEPSISSVQIVRIGIFNEREQYWPMIVRVKGSCLLNDPFNKGKRVYFNKTGDFRFFRDDYGDWQAILKGGMFQ